MISDTLRCLKKFGFKMITGKMEGKEYQLYKILRSKNDLSFLIMPFAI